MTENEAIIIIENEKARLRRKEGDRCEAIEMAIKALEEIQQYRAIGTVEECREAVEKQKAKKMESAWCPCCGKYLTAEYMNKKYHCIYCGQKLDWGDEE